MQEEGKQWIEKIYNELKKAEETHKRYYICCYFVEKTVDGTLDKSDIVMEGSNGTNEELIGFLNYTIDDMMMRNANEKTTIDYFEK